jgi:NAD+ synthase
MLCRLRKGALVEPLATHLSTWIADAVAGSGGQGVVFGLSGGIDSAVVAALAKRAFANDSLGVIMPCHSTAADTEDAHLVAHHFGLATATVDLGPVYDRLLAQLQLTCTDMPAATLACANLKPRLRMTCLYAFANLQGYRVLGTGNRSEIEVGYYTKYGDGGVDLLPLGSLTKTLVRRLAEHLGVPRRVIDKPPSAGLWSGQTDEGEMGVTYEQLDAYIATGEAPAAVREQVDRMHAISEHKRALPPTAPLPPDLA